MLGSFFTLLFTFVLYIPRKVLSFGQFCEAFTEGFKAMVPAILILTLAWTLSGVCREEYLNIGGFVSSVVKAESTIGMFMPAVFFLIALGSAFATRYLLGHVQHPDPDRYCGIRRCTVHHADHDRGSLPVRCGLRRPHLADFGYDHPRIRRLRSATTLITFPRRCLTR